MTNYVLEVCVDSVESALAAKRGGATRLELCANLVIGGTTPSMELFHMIKEVTELPIHVLIRPRFGDFLYTDFEYELMCRQIRSFTQAGADALVIGSLHADGSLNMSQMQGMIAAAYGKKITLHRAFDVSNHLLYSLEMARKLGVHTVLTSGGAGNCRDGMETIEKLLAEAGDMEILIGAGVDANAIEAFCSRMPAHSFHMSGKEVLKSEMLYRNERVSMGVNGISEFEMWRTSEGAVKEAAVMLKRFYNTHRNV